MDSDLNPLPELYRKFSEGTCSYNTYKSQMPVLIGDGQIPLSISKVMEKRIDFRNAPKRIKVAWMDDCFDTGDAIIYHPNGNIKIVPDSQLLRKINLETPTNKRGGIDLTQEDYRRYEGYEFKNNELSKICGKGLTKKEAKLNPIWRVLARDQNLLNDYADYIVSDGKKRWPDHVRDGNILEIGLENHYKRKTPEIRELFIFHHTLGSRICGRRSFNVENCELVGIVQQNSAKIKIFTNSELEELEENIEELSRYIKPKFLKSFRYLTK